MTTRSRKAEKFRDSFPARPPVVERHVRGALCCGPRRPVHSQGHRCPAARLSRHPRRGLSLRDHRLARVPLRHATLDRTHAHRHRHARRDRHCGGAARPPGDRADARARQWIAGHAQQHSERARALGESISGARPDRAGESIVRRRVRPRQRRGEIPEWLGARLRTRRGRFVHRGRERGCDGALPGQAAGDVSRRSDLLIRPAAPAHRRRRVR